MSHSNYSGRIARSMGEINPHMSGPVESMPDRSKDFWPGVALAVIAVVFVVMALAGWLPGAVA